MKRFISFFLVLAVVCSITTPFALGIENNSEPTIIYLESKDDLNFIDIVPGYYYIWPNDNSEDSTPEAEIGLAAFPPEESKTRGANVPTATWNIATSGQYNFSGSANPAFGKTLYTEYKFTGIDTYWFEIKNGHNFNVSVNFRENQFSSIDSFVVPAGSTMGGTPSISKSKLWYIEFAQTEGISVSGFVKAW